MRVKKLINVNFVHILSTSKLKIHISYVHEGQFLTSKIDFESQNFAIFVDFTQLNGRLKFFLVEVFLVLSIKDGTVK